MSVGAMSRVMELSEAAGVTRLVLLVMANRAGGDFDECFASVERIAFDCRIDHRTVQRAIKRLVKSGDLTPAGIHPKYRTNAYHVMPAQTVSLFTPAGVAESHPHGTGDAPVPPELEVTGVRGSATTSTSSHPTLAVAKRPRGRDEVFEALCEVGGHGWDDLNTVERGRLNKARSLARENGATPSAIRRAAERWPEVMGDATLTALGVMSNFHRLLTGPGRARREQAESTLDRMARELMEGGADGQRAGSGSGAAAAGELPGRSD